MRKKPKTNESAGDPSIPWDAPRLATVLNYDLRAVAAAWAQAAGLAPTRPDADRILATARVLKALDQAFERGDDDVLGDLERIAAPYLGSLTVRHEEIPGLVHETVGDDVISDDLPKQLKALQRAMNQCVKDGTAADDIAVYLLTLVSEHGSPLSRRLAERQISVRDREAGGILREASDRVQAAIANELARQDRGALAMELARQDGVESAPIGATLVMKALAALAFPNARHLYSFDKKRTKKRRERKDAAKV